MFGTYAFSFVSMLQLYPCYSFVITKLGPNYGDVSDI